MSLLDDGIPVVAVDMHNSFAFTMPDASRDRFIYANADVRAFTEQTDRFVDLDWSRCCAVVHLAGMSHAGACEKNPYGAFEANVSLTARLLDFCRGRMSARFIFPSTGLVYGMESDRPIAEEAPLYVRNIYTATKIAAENIVNGYAKSYGQESIIVRLSNIYGPAGNPDTILQIIIRQVAERANEVRFREGDSIRDFIFVDDVVAALKSVIRFTNNETAVTFNVSTGIGTSILAIAEKACGIAGVPRERIVVEERCVGRPSALVMDNRLLRDRTGWKPAYTLESGLTSILQKRK